MDHKTLLHHIYLYFSLLPIIAGLIRYRRLDSAFQFLLFTVIYAFLTDRLIYYFQHSLELARTIYRAWKMVEVLFLLYFLYLTVDYKGLKRVITFLLYTIVPIFILVHFNPLITFAPPSSDNKWFEMIVKLLISFLYAYQLLRWTEAKSNLLQYPLFWAFAAMFYDQFSSFFVHLLISLNAHMEVWFISNVNVILTLIGITVAFWKVKRKINNEERGSVIQEL